MGNGCGQCKRDRVAERTISLSSKRSAEQVTGTTDFLEMFCKPPVKERRGKAHAKAMDTPKKGEIRCDSEQRLNFKSSSEGNSIKSAEFPLLMKVTKIHDKQANELQQPIASLDEQEVIAIDEQKETVEVNRKTSSQDRGGMKVNAGASYKSTKHSSGIKKTRLLGPVNTECMKKPLFTSKVQKPPMPVVSRSTRFAQSKNAAAELKSLVHRNLLSKSPSQDSNSSEQGNKHQQLRNHRPLFRTKRCSQASLRAEHQFEL